MTTTKTKYIPTIGEKLYLSQHTGNYWVDSVRNPYTVIDVNDKEVTIQECKLIFNGIRYFDTLPDEILEDPNGEIKKLKWSNAKKHTGWIYKDYPGDNYPEIAHFGMWDYAPYLN